MGPLDEAMAPTTGTKSRKRTAIIGGVFLLALVPVLQSTFAANISVNSGGSIEFGQSVNAVAACDNAFTVTPNAAFDNVNNVFTLENLEFSSLDLSACDLKQFTVTLRDSSGNAITNGTFIFTLDSAYASGSGIQGIEEGEPVPAGSGIADNSNVSASVVYIWPGLSTSSDFAKITVETN